MHRCPADPDKAHPTRTKCPVLQVTRYLAPPVAARPGPPPRQSRADWNGGVADRSRSHLRHRAHTPPRRKPARKTKPTTDRRLNRYRTSCLSAASRNTRTCGTSSRISPPTPNMFIAPLRPPRDASDAVESLQPPHRLASEGRRDTRGGGGPEDLSSEAAESPRGRYVRAEGLEPPRAKPTGT
jgi:hypothetical protein